MAVGLAYVDQAYRAKLSAPFEQRLSGWSSSNSCRTCHPEHHASWARTFHRTMTQEATEASVLGAFDGREVTYWGVTARPVERLGKYFVEYLEGPGGRVARTIPVLRTVGSRRYQQYLTQDPQSAGENYYRIPLLWHIGESRWLHLNGAFLGHDDTPYNQHLALWNQNCIFCHNTGAVPGATNLDELVERQRGGEPVSPEWDVRYASEVSELGVACESCHGPAREHARRNRDPLRRYALHLRDQADPTVVNPARLDADLGSQVCGQCHGGRIPKEEKAIMDWLVDGHPYRPGENLEDYVDLILRDTPPPGGLPGDDLFSLRFWEDGTPRLTAYEYQGLLMSPCYAGGELSCGSCHTMHAGDIHGQITEEKRSNAACTVCHIEIGRDVPAHTRHAPQSSGSLCYECHMPRLVYGILEIHRSHRIETPDPSRDSAAARPNACTSCHLNRSPSWAAEVMREWWGDSFASPEQRRDSASVDMPDFLRQLHAGDPVQRAIAAKLAGRADTPLRPSERLSIAAHLLLGLRDEYPAVRWFARSSLLKLCEELDELPNELESAISSFDYIATPAERLAATETLRRLWNQTPKEGSRAPPEGFLLDVKWSPVGDRIDELLRLRSSKVIRIGE